MKKLLYLALIAPCFLIRADSLAEQLAAIKPGQTSMTATISEHYTINVPSKKYAGTAAQEQDAAATENQNVG